MDHIIFCIMEAIFILVAIIGCWLIAEADNGNEFIAGCLAIILGISMFLYMLFTFLGLIP